MRCAIYLVTLILFLSFSVQYVFMTVIPSSNHSKKYILLIININAKFFFPIQKFHKPIRNVDHFIIEYGYPSFPSSMDTFDWRLQSLGLRLLRHHPAALLSSSVTTDLAFQR